MIQLSELKTGESLPEVSLSPVTRLDLIKYAGASGDFNPIHTIDAEAEHAGLPGIIAHGMWTMGNLAKLFTPYLEEGFIKEYTIRFKGMVFIGDVVTLNATLKDTQDQELTFDVAAVNQDGRDVLKGTVVFSAELPEL
ncbi:MaoC/PaaZ C-terminal domain-containing protein [Planococcus lenghuensis]|uniref:Dehydratase n=1 Tax=Planococcus lenghuensis TaxID=2213202 RepID=A0A1Q2L0T9_9BACL|nr:MaoC/PaaZ C-terminal domain-containing protein [Planococcus lenghuensis]AQQ54075.1 dehydratase [Planococcus lenghuensis]